MQNVNEEIENNSDVLDTDFSDWNYDFFCDDDLFSDVENVCKSQNLIKNLQTTSNRISIQNGVSPLCREEVLLGKNVAKLNWKETNLGTLNTSRDLILPKERKQIDSLKQKKIIPTVRQSFDELSDSKNCYNPNKKRKKSEIYSVSIFSDQDKDFNRKSILQNLLNTNEASGSASVKGIPIQETSKSHSDSMTISSQETSVSQMASVSSQGSCSSKMITSSQEVTTSQKMDISTQENSTCQNITSSQESCKSPKIITCSQESLGNQVMNISIEESNILNPVNQSNPENQKAIIPHINFDCRQVLTHEALRSSKSSDIIQSDNTKTLNSQSFSKDALSVEKKIKADSSFQKKLTNSISDSSSNKIFRRYNTPEKRIIWKIRKRELEVSKREDAVEIREKLLDAREAAILKFEKLLITREGKYLRCKANMRKVNLKRNINSKQMRKKLGVLEETNAFSKCTGI